MPEVKIVGQGVDTLVLNVCYTNDRFQPVKRELDEGVQRELNKLQNMARLSEAPIPTRWAFKESCSLCRKKEHVDNGTGYSSHRC